MAYEKALLSMTIIISVLIVGMAGWLWYKFVPEVVNKIRGAKLWKGKNQKRIEREFEREYKRNVAPIINDVPLIADNFPRTMELVEELNESEFGNSLIFVKLIQPALQVVGMMTPKTPKQAQVVDAANMGSQLMGNPLADMLIQWFGKSLSSPQSKLKPPVQKAKEKARQTKQNITSENV